MELLAISYLDKPWTHWTNELWRPNNSTLFRVELFFTFTMNATGQYDMSDFFVSLSLSSSL